MTWVTRPCNNGLDCYLASPEVWKCSAFDRPQGFRGQSKFYGKNGVPPGRVLRDQNSGIFLSRWDIWHVCATHLGGDIVMLLRFCLLANVSTHHHTYIHSQRWKFKVMQLGNIINIWLSWGISSISDTVSISRDSHICVCFGRLSLSTSGEQIFIRVKEIVMPIPPPLLCLFTNKTI